MTLTIITITIIVTGLVGVIGGNYTKGPEPSRVTKWMMNENQDGSIIDVFDM